MPANAMFRTLTDLQLQCLGQLTRRNGMLRDPFFGIAVFHMSAMSGMTTDAVNQVRLPVPAEPSLR